MPKLPGEIVQRQVVHPRANLVYLPSSRIFLYTYIGFFCASVRFAIIHLGPDIDFQFRSRYT